MSFVGLFCRPRVQVLCRRCAQWRWGILGMSLSCRSLLEASFVGLFCKSLLKVSFEASCVQALGTVALGNIM